MKKKKYKLKKSGLAIILLTVTLLITGLVVLLTPPRVGTGLPVYALGADLSHLHSPHALLMEKDSNRILDSFHADEKIYPASMTKMMTAIIAIETLKDLDQKITVPEAIFPYLYAENASQAGFWEGETASVRDLLYGVLLPSGAECCLTLAYEIAGSEEKFVYLMNQKASELGMEHSHFVNTTGLHDDDQYTTCEDMAILFKFALQNKDFKEIVSTKKYTTAPTTYHPDGLSFTSTIYNSLKNIDSDYEILGGKTGYTGPAGQCLASYANVDGIDYVLITAKADGARVSKPYHVIDAITAYQQIGHYKLYNLKEYLPDKIRTYNPYN